MDIASMEKTCRAVRRDIINMTADAASGHPGGSLSAVEIITTLFFGKMNIDPANPKKADRDRFVLSKGHAAPCYYAVLGEKGFFDKAEFIIKYAGKCSKVVTVEEHSVIGGLGDAVGEVLLAEGRGVKFKKIGVNDIFGQSGKPEELLEEYGLSENQIYRRLKEVAET